MIKSNIRYYRILRRRKSWFRRLNSHEFEYALIGFSDEYEAKAFNPTLIDWELADNTVYEGKRSSQNEILYRVFGPQVELVNYPN